MKAVHAVWRNGGIVPTQPVDWPDGTALVVEPVDPPGASDSEGDLLGDTHEAIARWLAWCDTLEALIFTPEEDPLAGQAADGIN